MNALPSGKTSGTGLANARRTGAPVAQPGHTCRGPVERRAPSTKGSGRWLLLVAAWLASGAQAQYTNILSPNSTWSAPTAAWVDFKISRAIQVMQMPPEVQARMKELEGRRATSAASSAGATAAPRTRLAATDFSPTGARTMAEEIANGVADPSDRAQVAETCRQLLAAIEQAPTFRRNNLASATALLVRVSLRVGAARALDGAQMQRLLANINDELVRGGGFARLDDAQRTRMYDAMLMVGGLIELLSQNAAKTGNPAVAGKSRQMAREVLAALQLKA